MLKKYWNQIYINRNVKFMPFLYHGSHLGFQGIRTRKNGTVIFFLCLYHILTESGEFLLLAKKYTNVYFMTNEPTLTLSSMYHCYGISGFSNDEVLCGRPYGGCAILWRKGICRDVVYLDTGSSRLCAIRWTFDFGVVLLLNVYMPYENDDASVQKFMNQLSLIEGLLAGFDGDHIATSMLTLVGIGAILLH